MKRASKLTPRNPHVAPALFRKAGEHRKSAKALRASEKVETRRVARAVDPSGAGARQLASHPVQEAQTQAHSTQACA